MARDLTAGMVTEVALPLITPVWFIRLDITTDPVIAWTGFSDFTPSSTGDTAFDTFTFIGIGDVGQIGQIVDTDAGSQALKLKLPGIDLNDDVLKQVITNSETWQNRRAWIWYGLLNTAYGVIVDPTRVKTGKMDQLRVTGSGETGIVEVTIESHQANISEPLNTHYSGQINLDASDTSQNYALDLSSKRPEIGVVAPLVGTSLTPFQNRDPRNFQRR